MAKKKTRYIWAVAGTEPNLYVVKLHTYLNAFGEEVYDEPPHLNKRKNPEWAANMRPREVTEWWATTEKKALEQAIEIQEGWRHNPDDDDDEDKPMAKANILLLRARLTKLGK